MNCYFYLRHLTRNLLLTIDTRALDNLFGFLSDDGREIELIWTLFQGREEDELPKKNKEGITVKILKFLFGSAGGTPSEEPQGYYNDKRRFHRHVYQPAGKPTGQPASPANDSARGNLA